MKRDTIKCLVSLILALVLCSALLAIPASATEANYRRISGENRFETAFLVADAMKEALGVAKFQTVIVASGTNFADALSGSYLANVKNAPILLSYNDKYNDLAKDYIKANLAEGGTVYILGGAAAVPESMEAGLDGYQIRRLAGKNRFETNLAILKEAGIADGQEILVCTGTNFADSLSASATGLPILLVWSESGKLTDSQSAYLTTLNNPFCIIGGENAVSAKLENALASYGHTERLAGGNRFETSVLVAERYFDSPKTAVLAYAWNYPDGLCGGPLAYAMGCPLLLTMTKYEAQADAYTDRLCIDHGSVLGGEKLISDASCAMIFDSTGHTHIYTSKITTPATCTTAGVKTYVCECGDVDRTEVIPKTGHSYSVTSEKAGTCCEAGFKTYTCSKCSDSYTESTGTTEHSWVHHHTDEVGHEEWYYVCHCGGWSWKVADGNPGPSFREHKAQFESSAGHSYYEDCIYVVDTPASDYYQCSVCGAKAVCTDPVTGAMYDSHSWVHHHTDEVGHNEVYFMCHCGGWSCKITDNNWTSSWSAHMAQVKEETGTTAGHSYYTTEKWIVDTPASDYYKCSVCGAEAVCSDPVTGAMYDSHSWVHHHTDEVGHEEGYYVCHCGGWSGTDLESFAEHAIASGKPSEHAYYSTSKWVVDTPASDYYQCSVCGAEAVCSDPVTGAMYDSHSWVHHHTDEVGHEEWYVYCHCGKWSCPESEFTTAAYEAHVLSDGDITECSYYSARKWVIDTPASDYYKCSVCGATK